MRAKTILILLFISLAALAGCQQTTAEVEAQFCADLAAFDAALADLESLPDAATVDEVASAHEAVQDA